MGKDSDDPEEKMGPEDIEAKNKKIIEENQKAEGRMKDSTVAGDIRTLRKQLALHQSRLEVITPDEHGYLPLHYAAAYEQPDAAKQLLDNPQLQPMDAEKQSLTANGNGELSAHLCAKYARFDDEEGGEGKGLSTLLHLVEKGDPAQLSTLNQDRRAA